MYSSPLVVSAQTAGLRLKHVANSAYHFILRRAVPTRTIDGDFASRSTGMWT